MSATRQLLRMIDAQAAWSALLQPRGQVRHFILGLNVTGFCRYLNPEISSSPFHMASHGCGAESGPDDQPP